MNEKQEKQDNRGIAIRKTWQEIRQGGGRAYSIDKITDYLSEDKDKMLTRDEVLTRVADYFNSCVSVCIDEDTGEKTTVWTKNPTKNGLAVALGISRFTLIEYINGQTPNKKPFTNPPSTQRKIASEDFEILRRAYSLIEEFYESKLGNNQNNSGSIFWLLNANSKRWTNERDININASTNNEQEIASITDLPNLNEIQEHPQAIELPKLD